MSQHDFTIANQTASSARTDINNALQALASNNSGATAPTTTYANMLWYETDTNILKMRNEADSAWINLLYLDQSNGKVHILNDTEVVNTSGVKSGLLDAHSDVSWTTGTNTEARLVSPAQVFSVVNLYAIGMGQTWVNYGPPNRVVNTVYQNTTGVPIQVATQGASTEGFFQVSSDNVNFFTTGNTGTANAFRAGQQTIVPPNYYYRQTGGYDSWMELR